ncbi:MAG TPA: hypothetical protein VMS76_03335, partial [Planctomycetota bacterium]|nr:hypothetical protein [Planctomycetota bacterium]
MRSPFRTWSVGALAVTALGCATLALAGAQDVAPRGKTSFMPVTDDESFESVLERMSRAKPEV